MLYLEDLGVATAEEQKKAKPISASAGVGGPQGSGGASSGNNPVEDQIVWQLEMWKRAEMAKFLAHLKQKEIEKIEEVTRALAQVDAF